MNKRNMIVVSALVSSIFSYGFFYSLEVNGKLRIEDRSPTLELYDDASELVGLLRSKEDILFLEAKKEELRLTSKSDMMFNAGGPTALTLKGTTQLAEFRGYTKLGLHAPPVKQKYITGTTGSNQGASISIPHDIDSHTDIFGITIHVQITDLLDILVPPNSESFGMQYSYTINKDDIVILNSGGNSSLILSKPIKILITYSV